MLYNAAETARVPTLLAFRDIVPTRIEWVYGMLLTPVNKAYRTHGLALDVMQISPIRNGSVQTLLQAAQMSLSLNLSLIQAMTRMLMKNKKYPGTANIFASKVE